MGEDRDIRNLSSMLAFFLFASLLCLPFASANGGASSYSPPDNYLIDYGSPELTRLDNGRTFKSDPDSTSLLSTDKDILTSAGSIAVNSSSPSLPLYRSARIFPASSTYSFYISQTGRNWVRFYYYPLLHPKYHLSGALFTVTVDDFVLLHDFSVKDDLKLAFKEYLINISSEKFSLQFKPKKNSCAFVNAIEVVSAPDSLISDFAYAILPVGELGGTETFQRSKNVSVPPSSIRRKGIC